MHLSALSLEAAVPARRLGSTAMFSLRLNIKDEER